MSFKRQGIGGQGGVKGAFKRKLTGESLTLMDVSGTGVVYIANMAMEINLVGLADERIWVEASNLVALEAKLKTNQKFNGLRGATSGQGLFTTTVEGQGTVALLSDGPAIGLEVNQGMPLNVDPQAYVAHKGQLQQDFVTDVTWRTAVGQSSGQLGQHT
ncbi:MAG TPA: AIM24 family protein [Solirubrobacteraceae bacterium]